MNEVYYGDNLQILKNLATGSVDLVYIDPPFNTGKAQEIHGNSYHDNRIDYREFLFPRLEEGFRVLKETGSFYLHLDYRQSHSARTWMNKIFGGPQHLINEIIWAYDYGGRPKNRWPAKHDTILFYVKNPESYYFSFDEVDRLPYMAPSLVGAEKAARGKTPTDVWWHTIVPTNGSERVDYPTQKPLGIIRRIVGASSRKGDLVLDYFAGSGTIGDACLEMGRDFILIDDSYQAFEVMKNRLGGGIKYIEN